MKKLLLKFISFVLLTFSLNASPFNSKLNNEENETLKSGNVLIRNINVKKNMCLDGSFNESTAELTEEISQLSPKYLAEVIQVRPYKGNEDLPEKLEALLNNVPDYAGIPYWSERHQQYYDLYSEAKIKEKTTENNKTLIKADLNMDPFGIVDETIEITANSESILYATVNENKLRFHDQFDCVGPRKMKMCILLLKDEDNWYLYGIGGVNAPRIPFFTERIETSFINRIKTFCNFVFTKI